MKETALLHGQVMQTNIPTISEGGHGWEKILLWCTGRSSSSSKKESSSGATNGSTGLGVDELEAVEFMKGCLELDPAKRLSASEALNHPFLAGVAEGGIDGADMELD